MPSHRLDRAFFARSPAVVAPELVGATLVVGEVRARLVEVEAYLGSDDPASHAFRGRTPRAAIMFGQAGRLYVYLSYGMHHCANVVCDADGTAGAVLLRAAHVEAGVSVARRRRTRPGALRAIRDPSLLSGPGNLCRGLGLDLSANGCDVCGPAGPAHLESSADLAEAPIVDAVPRVGISRAIDAPLRFVWRGHPAVSARPR